MRDITKITPIARRLRANYNDSVIVEEFVEGADISMAYVESIGVLGPAAVGLAGADFYDYELKTERGSEVQVSAKEVPPHVKSKLHSVTDALVDRLDLKGYAKVDLRLDDREDIHLIEVNSQVSFHPEGEFAHCCQAGGRKLSNVVHAILDTGLHTPRRPSVGVRR